MLISAVLMIASLAGGDPDGIVATAPATPVDLEATAGPVARSVEGAAQAAVPHGLTTDQQIARWMTARPAADAPWVEVVHEPRDDRKVHGAASFGIGTGGYRDYGASVSLPIGETGRLDVSYREVENGYPYGPYGDGGAISARTATSCPATGPVPSGPLTAGRVAGRNSRRRCAVTGRGPGIPNRT